MADVSSLKTAVTLISLLLIAPVVSANEAVRDSALFRPKKDSGLRLQGVAWLSRHPQVINEDGLRVRLRGQFQREGWSLAWNDEFIVDARTDPRQSTNRIFSVEIPVTATVSRLQLRALSPSGRWESEPIMIVLREWSLGDRPPLSDLSEESSTEVSLQETAKNPAEITFGDPAPEMVATAPAEAVPENVSSPASAASEERALQSRLTPVLSIANFTFQQSRAREYEGTLLYGGVQWRLEDIRRPLFISADAHLSLQPLWDNRPDLSVGLFDAQLNLGFPLLRSPSGWRVDLLAGVFHSRIIVSDRSFGYSPLLAPQLFPEFTRVLSGGRRIEISVKALPMTQSFTIFSGRERLVGADAAWVREKTDGTTFRFTLGAEHLRMNLGSGDQVKQRKLILGWGIGW